MNKPEPLTQLPYAFAKKQGVVVAGCEPDGALLICHLPNTALQIFAEVKRLLHTELRLREVNSTEFQHVLTQAYESQSSILEATQGMDGDLDLMQLAGQLQVSEDLLPKPSNKKHRRFTLKRMKTVCWFVTALMASCKKYWRFNAGLHRW